jgi:hypothetical protein
MAMNHPEQEFTESACGSSVLRSAHGEEAPVADIGRGPISGRGP